MYVCIYVYIIAIISFILNVMISITHNNTTNTCVYIYIYVYTHVYIVVFMLMCLLRRQWQQVRRHVLVYLRACIVHYEYVALAKNTSVLHETMLWCFEPRRVGASKYV